MNRPDRPSNHPLDQVDLDAYREDGVDVPVLAQERATWLERLGDDLDGVGEEFAALDELVGDEPRFEPDEWADYPDGAKPPLLAHWARMLRADVEALMDEGNEPDAWGYE